MNHQTIAEALTALGHTGRLAVFRLLARRAPQGVRPSEIAAALDLKPNTLSVYLTSLMHAGLVSSRRLGRSVYYRIELGQVESLVDYLVGDCCRGRPELAVPLAARAQERLGEIVANRPQRPLNALFVCTGNSARSIMAEAILCHVGGGRFRAFSAGTRPRAEPHPFAIALLERLGHETAGLHPKDVAEFLEPGAPKMDFVFTVCDRAANEDCPPWPGGPISAHWGLPDPAAVEGPEAKRSLAFYTAYRMLRLRLEAFCALPFAAFDRISLQHRLDTLAYAEPPAEEARPAAGRPLVEHWSD